MTIDAVDIARLVGLDSDIRVKTVFRDRHELRAYLRALLLAKRLLENPDLVAQGEAYLERFVGPDPHQRQIYATWSGVIRLPVSVMVSRLLADDEGGAFLRDTAPVFVVIPPEQVTALARRAA